MFTSRIGMICLKPVTFLLNIIQKYSLQNKIPTTLRPLIAIFIVGKSGSRLIAILKNRRRLIVHLCQPYTASSLKILHLQDNSINYKTFLHLLFLLEHLNRLISEEFISKLTYLKNLRTGLTFLNDLLEDILT